MHQCSCTYFPNQSTTHWRNYQVLTTSMYTNPHWTLDVKTRWTNDWWGQKPMNKNKRALEKRLTYTKENTSDQHCRSQSINNCHENLQSFKLFLDTDINLPKRCDVIKLYRAAMASMNLAMLVRSKSTRVEISLYSIQVCWKWQFIHLWGVLVFIFPIIREQHDHVKES